MEKYKLNSNNQNSASLGHSSVSPGELVEHVDDYSLPSLEVGSIRVRLVNTGSRREAMGQMDVGQNRQGNASGNNGSVHV